MLNSPRDLLSRMLSKSTFLAFLCDELLLVYSASIPIPSHLHFSPSILTWTIRGEVLSMWSSKCQRRLAHDFLLLLFHMLRFFSAFLITALYCRTAAHLPFTLTSGYWRGRTKVLWDLAGLLNLSTSSPLLSQSLNISILMHFRMLASNLVQLHVIGSLSYT